MFKRTPKIFSILGPNRCDPVRWIVKKFFGYSSASLQSSFIFHQPMRNIRFHSNSDAIQHQTSKRHRSTWNPQKQFAVTSTSLHLETLQRFFAILPVNSAAFQSVPTIRRRPINPRSICQEPLQHVQIYGLVWLDLLKTSNRSNGSKVRRPKPNKIEPNRPNIDPLIDIQSFHFKPLLLLSSNPTVLIKPTPTIFMWSWYQIN